MEYERDTELARSRRSYEDGCGMAQALDLVGERWALLVVRELTFAAKRFSDLRADLPGIAPTVLTQRLADLEAAGIVARLPGRGRGYGLTDWGRALEPALQALGRWAVAGPHMRFDRPISVATMLMSMRTLFDPARAGDLRMAITFDFGAGQVFSVEVAGGRLEVREGPAAGASRVTGDRMALAACLYGGRPAVEAGLTVEDPAALARFAALFALPQS
ncbi:helix-turn-helix domain-containing protein [Frigidibacter sp. MR17.14]|uniref:winged helix-turn-helix transcriptional regulator n=1 Tax=Frigidibacter sp. MR17.14 TaxID=3126509 RepID=UPI003012AFC2